MGSVLARCYEGHALKTSDAEPKIWDLKMRIQTFKSVRMKEIKRDKEIKTLTLMHLLATNMHFLH